LVPDTRRASVRYCAKRRTSSGDRPLPAPRTDHRSRPAARLRGSTEQRFLDADPLIRFIQDGESRGVSVPPEPVFRLCRGAASAGNWASYGVSRIVFGSPVA
jgi:hypothetical protein